MKQELLRLAMATALFAGGFIGTFDAGAAANKALPRRGEVAERVKGKLGVTDEQAAKIKSELAAEKESITDLMHRLRAAQTELRETIQKPGASENEIRGAAAKVAAVEADAAVLCAKLHKKIDPLLTTEQQEKLKKMRGKGGQFVDRIFDRIGEKPGKQ